MTGSTVQDNLAYEVACAAVELLGDQWGAERGPEPSSALLSNGDPVSFSIAPDDAAGVLRIRNINENYTDDDTRLLPSGSPAVIAQHIYDVIGEIF